MSTIQRPVVKITDGRLRGTIEHSIYGKVFAAFRGIPYAKPPVGALRFTKPQPAEPWSDVRDASAFGPICAQFVHWEQRIKGSDDCLYLNVYTPPLGAGLSCARKPVMVWIHGGAFTFGSGNDTSFGPDFIIENDVILVTINYRLGVLGFLNMEVGEITGNQGLRDQILALEWVQKDIAAFGGDPDNVTIFGEGAGGSSVHLLTLCPLAKGLFHKAISQSSVGVNPSAGVGNSPIIYARKLASELGENINDPNLLLYFLQSFDAAKLVEADRKISREIQRNSFYCFGPTVDTVSSNPILPVEARIAAQEGVNIPYLMGHTSDEGMIFLAGMTDSKWAKYNSCLQKSFNSRTIRYLNDRGVEVSHLRKLYFGNDPVSADTRTKYVRLHGDVEYVSGIHEVAAIQAVKSNCPTYYYKFSYDNKKRSAIRTHLRLDLRGACHADELGYEFYAKGQASMGVPAPEPESFDYLVMERLTQMWTNFAKTGNPTPAITKTLPVTWQPVKNLEALECLNINKDLRMENIQNLANKWAQ